MKILMNFDLLVDPDKKRFKLENNAETAPGLPQAFEIINTPLVCPQEARLVNGECRAA